MKKIILFNLFFSQAMANTSTIELETLKLQSSKEKKTISESNESIYVVREDSKISPLKENNLEAINAISNITTNKEDETFTIRGVKNIGVTGFQKDNLASIIVDNIFQSDLAIKAGSFNLFDLQSLEIYRGAQSTTQGVNSLAGSLNIYHSTPSRLNQNKIFTEIGNAGKFNTGLIANSELIPDKLITKVSGSFQNNNGHITNESTQNKNWGKKEYINGNIDFLYKINDDDFIKITNKYFKSNTGGTYVDGPNQYEYVVRENQDSSINTNNAQSGIEYTNIINDNFTNSVHVSYSASKQLTNTDSDLTAIDKTGSRVDYHKDNYVSLENLLNFTNGPIKNVTGIHIHNYNLIDKYDFNVLWSNSSPVTLNIKQSVDRKRETYALFDSFNLNLSEEHALNLGLRYEIVNNYYSTNVSGGRNSSTGVAATDLYLDNYVKGRSGTYGGDNNNGKFLPKIGYTYNINNQSLGINLSEGYRTGGVSINRYRTTAVNYAPETTYNYELSYKGHFDQTKISQNIFYSDWRNQQVQIALSKDSYDTQVENAAQSRYFGGEFDISHSLSDQQEVSTSVGYVNTRFSSFTKDGKSYNGNQFPNAPKWTISLNHGYEIIRNLTIKSTLRHLSNSYADAENTKKINDQTYADLGVEYLFDTYSTELKIKNLFDKRYTMNSFTNLYGSYYQMSTPREISLQMSATF